ncbi:RT0821/Lpp0805 family surface protein [Nitrospirillum viridazoti]|uniref:RT0821/Lpp0805 family surface protein n=1 Tax=Nitrospirillum viridazoti TaxID=3144925 RepID=UPI0011A85257|nr:RT0821/Lpp0805 family surface protein [Nitrospirillum amazonense]TWB39845.1 outer membrane surface antigen [Nitrospirillum amazonense]
MRRLTFRALTSLALAGTVALTAAAVPALAQDRWDDHHRGEERRWDDHRGDDHRGGPWAPHWGHFREHDVFIYGRGPVIVPEYRRHVYRDVVVLRPYGVYYTGYGHYYRDEEAYRWLGLTAITLTLLDSLAEQQQRALEDAQIRATMAPVGQPVVWNDGPASGSVTTLRDGHTTDGQYCREFQQNVTIGGQTQQAYGTACQQPDGAWHVVADN